MRRRRLVDGALEVDAAIGALEAGDAEALEAGEGGEARPTLRECDEDDYDDDEGMPACCGDCDGDSDCAGNLVCHQRGSDDDGFLPGCAGMPEGSMDYCVDPDADPGTAAPTEWKPPLVILERPNSNGGDFDNATAEELSYLPLLREVDDDELELRGDGKLLECEGDCDDDDDCRGGDEGEMLCFERSRGSDKPVPGCRGEPTGGTDYCIHKNSLAYLNVCQGDCRKDADWYVFEGELQVYLRFF